MLHLHFAQSLSLELSCFALSLLLVAGYELYLRSRLGRDPEYTIQSVNVRAREVWVHNIMTGSGREILAVQTLRNSTMAATFLASTSILLIIGVLNLSSKDQSLSSLINAASSGTFTDGMLWEIKLLPMLVTFFWGFFCFSLAVRMYNHVGYLINATGHEIYSPSPVYVARMLNRGGRYYSFGMRAYYMSVPLVFWLFGPQYLLAATLGLVLMLYHVVDRAPDMDAPEERDAQQAEDHPDARPVPHAAGDGIRLVRGH
jgi:uncharacterized membrane protein